MKLLLRRVHCERREGGDLVDVHAELLAQSPQDALLEQAVGRLSLEPSVSAVTRVVFGNLMDVDEDSGDVDEGSLSFRHRLPLLRDGRS